MFFKSSSKYTYTDKLYRQLLLKTLPNVCEWCKRSKAVDISHILPKGAFIKMRYQSCNILLLCRYCHDKWHANPLMAADFLKSYKGEDYRQNLLLKNAMIPHKPDLKYMRMWIRQELGKYE